jgi:alkanesulfonate monooxygenase SsuD/methylene tetrahydromethanopterin reductase-like flavin-dependent oxidoreductase (luciferase family)
MRLGALVLPEEPWRQARYTWTRLEELGFDVGYAADHLTHPTVAGRWWGDGWTTLAAAAGVTSTLRLGTLVASTAVRSPTVLARTAATLQDLCDGRFVLGLGAGLPADVLADRGETVAMSRLWTRYEESVSALRALWLGGSTWEGSVVRIEGVLPVAHAPDRLPPPVVISAGGPRGFDLAARQGDGWVTFGGAALAEVDGARWWKALAGQSRRVTAACERIGRDPAAIGRAVLVGWGTLRPLASVQALADTVGEAAAAGFDEVVVYAPVGKPGGRFWADPDVVAEAVSSLRR